MRKLGLLGALILVLVFPCAANAAWQGSSPWNLSYDEGRYGDNLQFDPFNTGLMYAESDHTPGAGWFRESFDGGTSWGGTGSLTPGGKSFDVGFDGEGNRIWAYALSNTIAVTRGSSTGGPGDAPVTRFFSVTRVSDLKIAVNPAGDVLIGWASVSGGDPGAAFWAAEDAAPGPVQLMHGPYSAGCGSVDTPTPFLDADRSATFIWTCRGNGDAIGQSSTDDASDEHGFHDSKLLSVGHAVKGAQNADGRAVLLIEGTRTIPANSAGATTTKVLSYASRRAGDVFHDPVDLAGDAETKLGDVADRAAVTPAGRVLIGYSTMANYEPDNWCSGADAGNTNVAATGSINKSTGELALSNYVLSANTIWSGPPRVAIGPDGRLAVAFATNHGCGLKASLNERILLALDGDHFEEISNPYAGGANLRGFTFTAKGQLFVIAIHPAWPGLDFSNLYDTNVPLTPLVHAEPPGPSGSTGPAGKDNTPPVNALGGKSTQRIISVRRRDDGRLIATVKTSTAGTLTLVARSGKAVVATSTVRARAGISSVHVTLNRAASNDFSTTGHLNAKLTSNFAPTNGATPAPITRWVTFKRK